MMDTAILFAALTAVTIPAALAWRWWLRRRPGRLEDSRAAGDELQSAWRTCWWRWRGHGASCGWWIGWRRSWTGETGQTSDDMMSGRVCYTLYSDSQLPH